MLRFLKNLSRRPHLFRAPSPAPHSPPEHWRRSAIFLQVAQRLVEQAGLRPAIVDIKRAAIRQQRVEQRVAAHRVVPRHPVEVHARRFIRPARARLPTHGDVGAHHGWVSMTAFGMPVEPDVKSSFPTVSPVICAIDAATSGVTRVAARTSKRSLAMPGAGRSTCTTVTPSRSSVASAFAKRRRPAHNKARFDPGEDRAKLQVILTE